VGRDSSVGTATRYGLDGPGIECQWGRYFPRPFRPALGPTQLPIQWVPGLPGGKAAGVWRYQPTPSSAEVKERKELYLYTPSGPSWSVLGQTLPLPLHDKRNCILYMFIHSAVGIATRYGLEGPGIESRWR
jgi:hypothetical protein